MATTNENKNPTFKGDPKEASFFLLYPKEKENNINPFLLSKTLDSGPGTPQRVKPVIKTKQFLVQVASKKQVPLLLGLKKVGEVEVEVQPHPHLNSSKGILKDRPGVLTGLSEKEIAEGLKDEGVTSVRQIKSKRDGNLQPTNLYICTFSRASPPKEVKVLYNNLKVETYYPNPLRCYKCQAFGHHSDKCRSKARCLTCGSREHESEGCTAQPCCANCQGDHRANSPACPRWKLEKQVLKVKIDEDISIREARKRVCPAPSKPSYAEVSKPPVTTSSLLKDLKDIPLEVMRELVTALSHMVRAAEHETASKHPQSVVEVPPEKSAVPLPPADSQNGKEDQPSTSGTAISAESQPTPEHKQPSNQGVTLPNAGPQWPRLRNTPPPPEPPSPVEAGQPPEKSETPSSSPNSTKKKSRMSMTLGNFFTPARSPKSPPEKEKENQKSPKRRKKDEKKKSSPKGRSDKGSPVRYP